jgi:type IV secretion system protein VirB8
MSPDDPREANDDYHKDARSWEHDKQAKAAAAGKRDRLFGYTGMAVGLLAVAAVAGLTPLKQPVPVIIRVDNSTGIVDLVPTYEGTQNIDWLVTQGALNTYVRERERYFWGIVEADYEATASKQAPKLNEEMAAAWARENPQSPLNVFKDGTTVSVAIWSTTSLKLGSGKENVAQVRFSKATRAGGSGAEQVTHWIATIEYAYTKPSADPKTRSLNPLGFRVIEYHREPEVVATADAAPGGTR